MADKYLRNLGGDLAEREALVASAGAGDAGKIPGLDATGRLDSSFMPTGIGADTGVVSATEALAAGDLVNVYDGGSGAFKVRKADATNVGKRAHGFVLAAVASGANATVYFEGTDTQLTALTPGDTYLSVTTPGRTQATAPVGSGQIVQKVGIGVSATALNFQYNVPIILA
jgi:hypothetical protein